MALDRTAPDAGLMHDIAGHLGPERERQAFAALLYGQLEADDLANYTAKDLARFAGEAFDFISEKPRGRHKIRLRTATSGSGQSAAVTILEILNDDMPFLVDSTMGEMQARGLMPSLVLHPIFKTKRTPAGKLTAISGPGDRNWSDGSQESFITLHLPPLDEKAAGDLEHSLSQVLDDVRLAVADWQPMLARLDQAILALERSPPNLPRDVLAESIAFLRWLRDGQFTFLGMRDYRLEGSEETGELVPVAGSGLGVLRDPSLHVLSRRREALLLTPDIRRSFFSAQPFIITKSNLFSRIHRRAHMDYVGLKTYRADQKISGEIRIVGLFTSKAYTEPPRQIPFLRRKVDNIIARSGFPPGSHAAKSLLNVLETFPRDELFRIGEETLLAWAQGILDLELRPRVRVFMRPDRFDRFVSVLVYIQRDRFSTTVRERIGTLLAEAYNGRVTAFTPFFPEGPLVRVHFIIGRNDGPRPAVDHKDLERRITDITRTWADHLASALAAAGPPLKALAPKYANAFSAAYSDTFPVTRALVDISRIERLGQDRPVAIDFYREAGAGPAQVRAAVYRFDSPIPLSERVPVLENLGFSVIDERSYEIRPEFPGGRRIVILHDMMLEMADGTPIELARHDQRIEQCFLAVLHGEADNDSFNRLIVAAGADWREAAALRAYSAYLRQIRAPFGPRYIADTLVRHAGVARDLIELFRTRFDPDLKLAREERTERSNRIRARIEGALSNVPSLDEDRILRRCLGLVLATVRTNFFQRDAEGRPPATIAFKLASSEVDELPEPHPYREIWVYSPRVEGVHLRFGPIARGGIRWSDRAQDFRTEVLALCKAQQVKNTVIVPTGAKGGFLPKALPRSGSREAVMAEGIAAYRIFITALLSLTDDIRSGAIVPPERVVRHDGDDPYLVVAADKGTATFSDYANEIALQRGFWLGDAFASGGSAGYDHKKLGITARGAWECVKRHFREMDIDIQKTPFRVIGVGDMSGDVFGNGMLLSDRIMLIAAFDHRDIFIDPSPDPAASFAERKRLFALPRSSWQDYDRSRISNGGGVFSRSAKSIPLSDEMRALLGVDAKLMTPAELINAVLKAETDLLWFGGIGTYIRAPNETDEQVGDRANDAVRITADEVRAKVIGEGANLGVTQRGRIAVANRGVRINTDFIDNSAGVNTSDQEVNIKIALGSAVAAGRLDLLARNRLLAEMAEHVAAACLANNYQQSLALSLAERASRRGIGYLARLIHALEDRGLLDRKLEALPSDAEIGARQAAGVGFTRPELAVLLSWSKIALNRDLLASSVPDDSAGTGLLFEYFPPPLRERFAREIESHRLRREIVATRITNSMINRGGPAMAVRLADETGRTVADIAYAFMAARAIFALPDIWAAIGALDGSIAGALQVDLYGATQDLLIEQTGVLLRQTESPALADLIARYRPGIESLTAILDRVATPAQQARMAERTAALSRSGVPSDLSRRIACFEVQRFAPMITDLARETDRSIEHTARVALAASDYLRLADLEAHAARLRIADHYDRLAIDSALEALRTAGRGLARSVLREHYDRVPDFAVWAEAHADRLSHAKGLIDEIAAAADLTVSRLTVAASRVRALAGA
ncbi:MAG TPA: NAD-glutamate dehydrogenase [Hyphomicrobiaceae bacterium]|nr:NAD-glutamate dehydrogenase [Hyphomicrobiaceae bacterium]